MKLTIALALILGAYTMKLNRPHEKNYFAAGVSEDDVNVMANDFGNQHYLDLS